MHSLKLLANPFTEKWNEALLRYWTVGQLLNILQFNFDKVSKQIQLAPLFPNRLLWWILYFLYSLDVAHMCHAAQFVTLSTVSEKEFVQFYVHYSTRLNAWLLMLLNVICAEDLAVFWNFLRHIGTKQRLGSKVGRLLETILSSFITFMLFQPIFPLIQHFQSRQSARYWPARYLRHDFYNETWVAAMYALNDLIFSYLALYGSLFSLLPVVIYTVYAQQWALQLKNRIKMRHVSLNEAVRRYKEQRFLNRIFNSTYSSLIMPGLVGNSLAILALLLGSTVSSFNSLPFPVVLNCTIGLLVVLISARLVLKGGGILRNQGLQIKQYLSQDRVEHENICVNLRCKSKRKKRILMGCIEIRLKVSTAYAKTESFAQFINEVMIQTVNYLLAIGERRNVA